MIFFRETEFFYLFLRTVNVNNINFREEKWVKNW